MAKVSEVLSFYTPYAESEKMRQALTSVLRDDITAFEETAQGFYLELRSQEYLKIPYVSMESDPTTFQEQIQRLYVSSAKLPCDNILIKQNLLYQIALFRGAYVFTFNYEEFKRDEKILPLMEIADQMDALIFWETGDISDSYGDVILNRRGISEVSVFNPVDGFDLTEKTLGLDERAMKRIHHSMTVLRYKGIYAPTSIAPPFDDRMYVFQSEEEVIKRAIACMLLGVYSDFLLSHQGNAMLAYENVETIIRMYRASPYFTIREIEYLNDQHPPAQDIHAFQGYYECAYTLLWSIGLFENLYFPSALCSDSLVVNTIMQHQTIEQLLAHAKLRTKDELLDALDLHQRYAWACQDAVKLSFTMPAGLLFDVVRLRHRTLCWLVAEHDSSWDDVQPQIASLRHKKSDQVEL